MRVEEFLAVLFLLENALFIVGGFTVLMVRLLRMRAAKRQEEEGRTLVADDQQQQIAEMLLNVTEELYSEDEENDPYDGGDDMERGRNGHGHVKSPFALMLNFPNSGQAWKINYRADNRYPARNCISILPVRCSWPISELGIG